MYPASENFLTAIKAEVRHPHWSGSINTPTPIELNDNNFLSGNIQRAIAGNKLIIGTVYAAQITAELYLPTISRYELYGKTIENSMSIEGADDVIPMGIFIITEATQTADHIKIKGYDNMVKFADVAFSPTLNNKIQTAYSWLVDMCEACGVVLGVTKAQIEGLPNGNRQTGFADVVSDVRNWRDVLGYLAAYLGSYAYIGRDGKLYLGVYSAVSDDTVPANLRYSSNLSDFRTTYDGLYATYKDGGVQEYVSNNNSDGLVLDLGTNPFLQFSNQTNRLAALQEIIDAWNGVYYVPFNGQMPLMSHYDVGDVLTFTGNQAAQYDIGAITDIVYDIKNDIIKIKCGGDNPKLTSAQDRFTKTVAGLSADYNNGQEVGTKNFWLLHTENTSQLTIPNNVKTQVAEIEFKQNTDVQRMGLMFTSEVSFPTTAKVRVLITIDDSQYYEFDIGEEKMMKGLRPVNRNCGFRITDKGTHVAKVYLTIVEEPLKWSEIG